MKRSSLPLKSRTYNVVFKGQKSCLMKNTSPIVPYLPVTTPGPFALASSCHPDCPEEEMIGTGPGLRSAFGRSQPLFNWITSPSLHSRHPSGIFVHPRNTLSDDARQSFALTKMLLQFRQQPRKLFCERLAIILLLLRTDKPA